MCTPRSLWNVFIKYASVYTTSYLIHRYEIDVSVFVPTNFNLSSVVVIVKVVNTIFFSFCSFTWQFGFLIMIFVHHLFWSNFVLKEITTLNNCKLTFCALCKVKIKEIRNRQIWDGYFIVKFWFHPCGGWFDYFIAHFHKVVHS